MLCGLGTTSTQQTAARHKRDGTLTFRAARSQGRPINPLSEADSASIPSGGRKNTSHTHTQRNSSPLLLCRVNFKFVTPSPFGARFFPPSSKRPRTNEVRTSGLRATLISGLGLIDKQAQDSAFGVPQCFPDRIIDAAGSPARFFFSCLSNALWGRMTSVVPPFAAFRVGITVVATLTYLACRCVP
jgi:hypothetical protein